VGDLSSGAKLRGNEFGFPRQGLKDDVLLALLINEIVAPNFGRSLHLAIDAAIALFESRGIPREIKVDQVVAALLQIDAFARRVRADQDS
jgi:hypothetical protein